MNKAQRFVVFHTIPAYIRRKYIVVYFLSLGTYRRTKEHSPCLLDLQNFCTSGRMVRMVRTVRMKRTVSHFSFPDACLERTQQDQ